MAVDDNIEDRRLVTRSLSSDFDVVSCGSGEEAVAILSGLHLPEHEHYSVVVADYHLPGMNGVDFLSAVSGYQPDAGRILITADPSVPRPEGRYVVLLYKPILPAALYQVVRTLASSCERQRAANERARRITADFPKPPNLPKKPG